MPKNCWILLVAAFWLLASGPQLPAATNAHFAIVNWDADTGLPQNRLPENTVTAITQTRDGYLWLGTLDGLARFDGLRFATFDESNTPGLTSSRILKIFEDSQTNLWIWTEGAGIFLVRNGQVKKLDLGQGAANGRLVSICEDAHGSVWFYTANGEYARYRDLQVSVGEWAGGLPSETRPMIADDSGRIWIGTDSTLTPIIPPSQAQSSETPRIGQGKHLPGLELLLASKHGGFWCLANGGIFRFKGDQSVPFAPYPWNPGKTPVTSACEDEQGNLIVGTLGEGLFWFDQEGRWTQLTTENGLSHNRVLSLCFDREANLWVGTNGKGLCRVKRQVFEVLDHSLARTVRSVSEDSQGNLWIGYNEQSIECLAYDGTLLPYKSIQGLSDVRSVLADTRNTIWAGTLGGRGLLQLQNGLFLLAPGAEFTSRDAEISALYEDRKGQVWVGRPAGYAIWDGQQWTTNDSLGVTVRAIVDDSQGSHWIGTQGSGLLRLRGDERSVFTRTNGLPSDNVRALHVDREGALWVGTSGGLARYRNGQWFTVPQQPGLSGGGISYLIDDLQGHLWIGTASGLKRVSKADVEELASNPAQRKSLLVRSFGRADGLPSGECTQGSQPAACRTRNGKLWFPTIAGLASVDPASLHRNTNPPPVVFESVRIDGQLQGSTALRALQPQTVTVPANRENLEIRFTSLNLSAAEEGLFMYRMEPYETAWISSPGTARFVRYPKLPHGQYRFQVRAFNEDGVESETIATLPVTVLPAFYQTWWFATIAVLTLVGLIAGSVHYVSTQKLQRQLADMRHQEELEKERSRIARDLHDQLGANLTQVALLGEMAEADKELPQEVESHARQISQTARDTTRALDEIVWTVNPSNDTLEGLINYLCKYAQEYLALGGLRYRLEVPPQLPALSITPELRHNVFLAAKEAVNNIVKHSHANSAWLRLALEPDRFILELEDNGLGLPPEADKKGRNGLRNMRKRMEDIGGAFEVSAGAEGGTRIRLSAPLKHANNN
jgi:ligand-binding sensor domain-containing protein/signal transduction histidine kinase